MKTFINFSACLHGIDAENVKLRRDKRNNALYVELDAGVDIRLDLKRLDVLESDRTDELELERDRGGLLRLAAAATQAAQELGQLLGVGVDEDQAAEDIRRLGEIRAVLAAFDWEHDDRQYALEAIVRIAEGES